MITTSTLCFAGTILVTLLITAAAARRNVSQADYYTAGSRISGLQNGWAIAGDFMSATTFLGLTALYFTSGVDTSIYYLTPLAGFCLMLLLLARPLRRLGRYTLGDVMVSSLRDPRLRLFSGASSVIISIFYLVAQLVGAGALIATLFGFSFNTAVTIIGVLMVVYVAFGGMLAATWVQITKAALLLTAAATLALLCLIKAGGIASLYERATDIHALGARLFQPGGLRLDPFSSVSLAVGLVLGMAGMPHLLIRFFTVPNEKEALRSVTTATGIVALAFLLLFAIVGPGAVAFVTGAARFRTPDGGVLGGPNMVAMHLSTALGGQALFGIMAAVAFATILAVVAGLTIAVASAASHDLYATLRGSRGPSEKTELRVFRTAVVLTAMVVVSLAIAFQHENVAFLSAMAFSVAASTNFPILMLTLYWNGLTPLGALVGGGVGLVASTTLIVLGPAVWVKVLGHAEPVFPSEYPALVTTPLAVISAVAVSMISRRPVAQAAA